jgi:hypothetical protein
MGIQGIIPLRGDVKCFLTARANAFNQTVDVATALSLDVLTESLVPIPNSLWCACKQQDGHSEPAPSTGCG